jgi:hypothetical protein
MMFWILRWLPRSFALTLRWSKAFKMLLARM